MKGTTTSNPNRFQEAVAFLEKTHEVYLVEHGSSSERLADRIKQQAYNAELETEVNDILDDWKRGSYLNQDSLMERIHECKNSGISEDDALDILRYTDNRDAYSDGYGAGDCSLECRAVCAFQQDVRDRLEREGIDLNDPAPYTIDCPKCGEVPCEEGADTCPVCSWVKVVERYLYLGGNNVVICDDCLEPNEADAMASPDEGTEAMCNRCGEMFREP